MGYVIIMAKVKQLHIEVKDKIATLKSQNFTLVGGNNDYDVVFDFDEDWENIDVKTAIFVYKDKTIEQVFGGNVCEGIAIEDSSVCLIGVLAGDIHTTSPAIVEVTRSIRDEMYEYPVAPEKNVYDQIIQLLNSYMGLVNGGLRGGLKGQILRKNGDEDFDFTWQDEKKGVYVLGEGETLDDVPIYYNMVIDPKGESDYIGLPVVTEKDNGKILEVGEGNWQPANINDSAVSEYIDKYIEESLKGDY